MDSAPMVPEEPEDDSNRAMQRNDNGSLDSLADLVYSIFELDMRRVDLTSYWAIIATFAILAVSFAPTTPTSIPYPFGMLVLVILLFMEAERYRWLYDARIELDAIRRALVESAMGHRNASRAWLAQIKTSHVVPKHGIEVIGAISRRFRRLYGGLFLFLTFGWLSTVIVRLGTGWTNELEPSA